MKTTPQSHLPHDNLVRPLVYVAVAVLALLVGYLFGLLGGSHAGRSRADWPPVSSGQKPPGP